MPSHRIAPSELAVSHKGNLAAMPAVPSHRIAPSELYPGWHLSLRPSTLVALAEDRAAPLPSPSPVAADGVAEARKSIDELESWLADGSNCEFVEKIQAAVKADPRAVEDAELAESMMSETLGVLNLADGRSCAVVHERGRPRWGPVRNSKSLVDKDRKDMKNAIRSGTLDALLLAYRRDII